MKKLISFLLALVLLCGLLPAAVPVSAAADDQTTPENGGLKLNKTAEYDEENDQYWITLEAYATGTSTTINTAAPVDFVLVLDQSGSMANKMSTNNYNAYTGDERKNSNLYTKRHDNSNNQNSRNLHYKDGSTYYPVYVTRSQTYVYTALPATTTNTSYYSKRNNLYADPNGNTRVDVSWGIGISFSGITYTYEFGSNTLTSTGRDEVPSFISNGNYTFYERSAVNTYTYTYVKNGATYTIGTSTGDDTLFTDATLYSYTSDTSATRLDSLITAANTFADSVHKKAVEDNLDHRVAVVGFASNTSSYKNTEVLTGVTVSDGRYITDNGPSTWPYYYYPKHYNYQGTQYGDRNINTAYKNALQDMKTDAGYKNVTDAIGYLTAYGGTQTDHGLAMAKGIFEQNPIQAGESRKRVVVLLTDGIPTGDGSDYSSSTYSSAKTIADTLKGSSYNAIIYTIGIFDGANAEKAGSDDRDSSDADKGNYVCQQLSSNNGTPPTSGADSYYLSASTQESLNKIFLKIAGELKTTTSASTELGTSTTVQDVVAPQFQLPDGFVANQVELKTYPCNGVDSSGNPTFSSTANTLESVAFDAMGAEATVDTNGKLNVNGFDYKENWCGQATDASGGKTYCGNKLVIRFPVEVKDGFLGGNDVYTNTEAKVYPSPEDAALGVDAVGTFPRPQVNVPIGTITVTTTDKNVYLTQIPDDETLKSGITVKCGDVDITDPSKLADWQTAYVDITTTVTTPDGFDATADDTGKVTATVSPKTSANTSKPGKAATEQTETGTYKINVFKPELTFIDGEVWYGDTAPTDYTTNKTKEVWKHDSVEADTETMGEAPQLTITCTPGDGIDDGKVATKSDIPVKATVSIGNTDVTKYTNFVHGKCDVTGCTWDAEVNDGDPAFLLHVKTCSLTITKTGDTVDGSDYFVFDIKQDGKAYTQATIKGTGSVTITGLPVGTYDVSEDGSTAWRYTSSMAPNSSVTLSSANPAATVTCTNTKTENKWLNDFTRVTNVYGATSGVLDGN